MTSIRFNPISDLILLSMKVEGVDKSDLGLNFISKFNINISFARGIIDIEPHDGYEWITF